MSQDATALNSAICCRRYSWRIAGGYFDSRLRKGTSYDVTDWLALAEIVLAQTDDPNRFLVFF